VLINLDIQLSGISQNRGHQAAHLRHVTVSDRDGKRTIIVSSDTRFIRSLDRLGFVSLDPSVTEPRS
jgi:hypothetical protein